MGFFGNLKAGIEGVAAAQKEMAAAVPEVVPLFVNPKSQQEVDQAWQGTGPVRAILFGTTHQTLERGERIGAMRVNMIVRPRGPGEVLGEKLTLKSTLSSMELMVLVPGLDVPVARDPATGALTRIDSALLKQELAPLRELGAKRNPSWAWDDDIQGMIEVGEAIGKAVRGEKAPQPDVVVTPSMSDPRREPIDGITWETWVALRAHLQVKSAPYGVDHEALKFGITAYTWPAIDSAWGNRTAVDPELKQLFDHDLAAAVAALG